MYIGNKYGAGTGSDCLDYVKCTGTETWFLTCGFNIFPHRDPSQDVSIQCFPGMILAFSIAARTDTCDLTLKVNDLVDLSAAAINNAILQAFIVILSASRLPVSVTLTIHTYTVQYIKIFCTLQDRVTPVVLRQNFAVQAFRGSPRTERRS